MKHTSVGSFRIDNRRQVVTGECHFPIDDEGARRRFDRLIRRVGNHPGVDTVSIHTKRPSAKFTITPDSSANKTDTLNTVASMLIEAGLDRES